MNLTTRKSVIEHFERHKGTMSPAYRDALVAFHDALPCDNEAQTREQLEARLCAAWKLARMATTNDGERHRRMAQAVAGLLVGAGTAHARRVYALYLRHGMKRVNATAIDLALEPMEPFARFRLLEQWASERAPRPC